MLNTSPVTAGGKTFIPKVHPEKNFALLSQIPQGTEVTHVPPEREKKSSKLYWEGHLVGSTLNCMKIQQGNHGRSPKSKSEMASNFKWLFMFPHKQVTREVCFNHNSATNK